MITPLQRSSVSSNSRPLGRRARSLTVVGLMASPPWKSRHPRLVRRSRTCSLRTQPPLNGGTSPYFLKGGPSSSSYFLYGGPSWEYFFEYGRASSSSSL